ncbi:helix-turn-helix domain-containing protein [uncultured Sneathiella sp.]|jgi:DNA-binding transcriptional ArsR family regulator|uniref:ArsR/SmtB family transcription factor n=1 Tax=uncultured Sneathiella sp. TaxID=879315 RepID=UPI0030DCCDA7|tara:strand:- start:9297 stop:9977 length:681 start_codon:yes stop_codon:yes gene_type:complete
MKEGPDIALLGSLIGEPARANMLTALLSGKALTASELAGEAGISAQTASSHLAKMQSGGLLIQRKQGRHRYFALADDDVGSLLEAMMGLAAKKGHLRTRTGPKDPALRHARVCYNHLAGDLGVQMMDSLLAKNLLTPENEGLGLTESGKSFFEEFAIDFEPLEKLRRPLCKSCLDWSNRRSHLAGSLGSALLTRFNDLGWARRLENSRIVSFNVRGEREFMRMFAV